MRTLNFSILNEKELLIVSLWLCGQTAKQTGRHLERSGRTIEFHREKIKCRLGVYSESELWVRAIKSPEFIPLLQKGKEFIQQKDK